MVPFLQNDDANRALMGSNMQRQAVPLMITETPVVGTGIEEKAAVDSGVCVIARNAGTVEMSASNEIIIKRDDTGEKDDYHLTKFQRSNQSNSYNQKPIVFARRPCGKGRCHSRRPEHERRRDCTGKEPADRLHDLGRL
jgi:DNA-directed RNA polymerase subunit beta